MPDILKVTTPLINKNQTVAPKSGVEGASNFNIQDTTRVIQTHNQSELQGQNTGMLDGGEAPALLLNLLRDPAVAVSYLKNIFLLEEIFRLLPANNTALTPEIEQAFSSLVMQSPDIGSEMLRQENASTSFKGPIFDFLRALSDKNISNPEMQQAIATFLRAANAHMCKSDVLDAVRNSLIFLRDNLSASTSLSGRLDSLIAMFAQQDRHENFSYLKNETLNLLKSIEDSILFSPKMSRVLSIIVYNLSRYNTNSDFYAEAAFRLRQLLPRSERQQFAAFADQLYTQPAAAQSPEESSKVMEALIRLVAHQSSSGNQSSADSAKVDHILHSLLSSPCNFTPLLHFIVPVMHEQMRAFAEIWINPRSDEQDMPSGTGPGMHFLLVIDVESLGRFETELFVHGSMVDIALFCPPGYEDAFKPMIKTLPKAFEDTPYRAGQMRVEPLERSRSLMDVFKSLPYKRVGVDVKI